MNIYFLSWTPDSNRPQLVFIWYSFVCSRGYVLFCMRKKGFGGGNKTKESLAVQKIFWNWDRFYLFGWNDNLL